MKIFDASRCIICQRHSDTTFTSTENERWKIIEAASVRKDHGVRSFGFSWMWFVYHVNNACYKSYTLGETLESIQKSAESNKQTIQCGNESGKNVEPCRKRIVYCYQFSWYIRKNNTLVE